MTDAGEAHIKRPMNAFMVWSSRKRKDLAHENPSLHNSQISKILGIEWGQLAEQEKRKCFAQAKILNELHMIKYPDYKYRPKKRAKKKKPKHNGVFPPRCYFPQLSAQVDSTKESDEQETSSTSTGKAGDDLDVKHPATPAVVKFEDGTETHGQQLPEHETLIMKKEKSRLESSAFEKRGNYDERSFQGMIHDGLARHYHPMCCLPRPPEDLHAAQARVSRREILSTSYIGHLQVRPYVSMDAMFRYRTMDWQFLT